MIATVSRRDTLHHQIKDTVAGSVNHQRITTLGLGLMPKPVGKMNMTVNEITRTEPLHKSGI
jgi:hypothetical protein